MPHFFTRTLGKISKKNTNSVCTDTYHPKAVNLVSKFQNTKIMRHFATILNIQIKARTKKRLFPLETCCNNVRIVEKAIMEKSAWNFKRTKKHNRSHDEQIDTLSDNSALVNATDQPHTLLSNGTKQRSNFREFTAQKILDAKKTGIEGKAGYRLTKHEIIEYLHPIYIDFKRPYTCNTHYVNKTFECCHTSNQKHIDPYVTQKTVDTIRIWRSSVYAPLAQPQSSQRWSTHAQRISDAPVIYKHLKDGSYQATYGNKKTPP
ncbi:hypothetical protein RF11_03400 [Thelohanellus kitauei]|uniref:Uncharacterized protein n=1 Tax=Thelohanellus kitauei TaxID=669202 RepID=A0A0C2MK79_THEKT|nr:hypothetical protein RF11_03400 [Thelohanellus kitauei]